jgi:hypothetical protein
MTLIFVIIIIDRWELKKNPRNNDDDPNRQSEKSSEEKMSSKLPYSLFERNCYVLFILNFVIYFRLRRESAEVDRELEASQRETARLREVLRQREQEVQALRERVAAQRARRAAREALEAKKNLN